MMPFGIHTAVPSGPPRDIRWTVDQFHYLGDLGCFEGRRAMLIDGFIVEEGPMNPPHAIAGTKTEDLIREAFGRGWHLRVQKPMALSQRSDPEPDVAVVPGRPADYTSHPTTAALIIEISDSSLRYDTTEKMRLYAAAGIADYWVLDVTGRRLLVHRTPRPEPGERFGHGYADVTTFGPDDTVSPLAVPGAVVRVGDMLP
jgi:Uma2 family endonuclease